MARMKKDSTRLYCEIRSDLAERLQAYSDGTGVPKTVVVEKALAVYFGLLDTGQVPGAPVPGNA